MISAFVIRISGAWIFDPCAFDAGLGRQLRQPFERRDELGPAVGVTGVVERVHADEDVMSVQCFRPRERERQEHRVAGRHVGGGDVAGVQRAVLGDVNRVGQRRPAKGRQVDRQLDVAHGSERPCDGPCRLDLASMPLAVEDRQRIHVEAACLGHGGGSGRVEPAAEQHDGAGR